LWGLALDSVIRHAAAGRHTLNWPGLWIKPTGIMRVFVWSFVLTYGKVLLSARSGCLSRWGVKMKKPEKFPVKVILPLTFYKDHLNRGCGSTAQVVEQNKKFMTVILDEQAWIDIYSDADYYISMMGTQDYPGNESIVASAVRTMVKLDEAVA
jgi:hypothetical protein